MDEFAAARAQFERLVEWLGGEESESLEHGEVESLLHEDGMERLRKLLQGYLDRRSRIEQRRAERVDEEGQKLTHCREGGTRSLMSLFGEVEVKRKGYSARGHESVFPLDEELNLPGDKYSHGLRAEVAQAIAQMSFEETGAQIDRVTGGHVPKRQVEALTVGLSVGFLSFYAEREGGESEGEKRRVMTVDGKGVVMRREGLRAGTRQAAARAGRKLKTRLCRGEKSNRKRMATVAAIYDMAPHPRMPEQVMGSPEPPGERPRPENKQVWASLERAPSEVIDEVFQEALRRDPQKERRWVVLVDGQESQLRELDAAAKRHGVEVTVVQDFIHVLEYLWKAASCFHPPGSEEAEAWVRERATNLLRGKVVGVAAGMRRSATRRDLSQEQRKSVDKCADDLLKNRSRLAFEQALAAGLPIATGVIEGACRYLVKDRMDITGARWGLTCAEAVLKLRALHTHGDLPAYLAFHFQQERKRRYESAAA